MGVNVSTQLITISRRSYGHNTSSLHLINNGVKVKGTQTVLYGCDKVNIAKCPPRVRIATVSAEPLIFHLKKVAVVIMTLRGPHDFLNFVFTGTGRDPRQVCEPACFIWSRFRLNTGKCCLLSSCFG